MSRTLQAILWGGAVAGVLDLCYAFVVYGLSYGMTPMQVLHSVASGWIGAGAAKAGGWNTAALGFATHFTIATVMAAVFVLAATGIKALTADALISGLVYGLILYVAMNYVVVPLSAAHPSEHFASSIAEATERLQIAFSAFRPKDPLMLLGTVFTHTAFVGIPIAFVARRFLGQ